MGLLDLADSVDIVADVPLPSLKDIDSTGKMDAYMLADYLNISSDFDDTVMGKLQTVLSWAKESGKGLPELKKLSLRVADKNLLLDKLVTYISLEREIRETRNILGTLVKHRTELSNDILK